jgi:hypothetical protein
MGKHEAQVAYLKGRLSGSFKIRSLSLVDGDWTSLMKTTRTRFIVPDQDLDDAKLAELELDDQMDGGVASTSSAGSNGKSVVTGSTPQVLTTLESPSLFASCRGCAHPLKCASCGIHFQTIEPPPSSTCRVRRIFKREINDSDIVVISAQKAGLITRKGHSYGRHYVAAAAAAAVAMPCRKHVLHRGGPVRIVARRLTNSHRQTAHSFICCHMYACS